MRPRAVDWTLFLLVAVEFCSGLGSFLIGRPEDAWFFILHSIVGLSILPLLFWKFRRVQRRVTEPRRWQPATMVSVLTALAVLATIGTGLFWATAQRPINYPNGMILHTTAAIVLVICYLWHLWLRFKPLPRRDVQNRRTALRFLSLFVVGGALWGVQEGANRRFDLPGVRRRFTGSRRSEVGEGNSAFPVTMWMFDNPAPVDVTTWRLQIGGAVATPVTLGYADLAAFPPAINVVTLDCTGGWFATQTWTGIRVGDLLEQVQPAAAARFVRFTSVTGYRWSLPLAEAHETILATHVGGELLNHGHGAPLRLVTPGRRGFQWVKWVTAVELLTAPDRGQWAAIFLSGVR
jgi:DMSO/TMAO reductase YedYZ molybdopterin-dependent catalytic subunit